MSRVRTPGAAPRRARLPTLWIVLLAVLCVHGMLQAM
jgi:hypothetical protein